MQLYKRFIICLLFLFSFLTIAAQTETDDFSLDDLDALFFDVDNADPPANLTDPAASETAPAEDLFDDLFIESTPPPQEGAAGEAPADQPPVETPNPLDDLDDLFNFDAPVTPATPSETTAPETKAETAPADLIDNLDALFDDPANTPEHVAPEPTAPKKTTPPEYFKTSVVERIAENKADTSRAIEKYTFRAREKDIPYNEQFRMPFATLLNVKADTGDLFFITKQPTVNPLITAEYEWKPEDYMGYNKHLLPTVGLGVGLLTILSDYGTSNAHTSPFGRNNTGFHLFSEYRYAGILDGMLGGSMNILKGSVAQTDNKPGLIQNFRSSFFQTDVNVVCHLDNGMMLPKDFIVSPFVSVGVGFMGFNPKGDFLDAANRTYHLWPSGQLMDQPLDYENFDEAVPLSQDYVYETQLDPGNTYAHSSFIVPLGVGFSFKLFDIIETKFSTTYYLSSNDYLDGYNPQVTKKSLFGTGNDNYLYSAVTFQYNLSGLMNPKSNRYKHLDFELMDRLDTDADGVRDFDDECQNTKSGIAVGLDGCPLDDDHDGVPNSVDKELNTTAGAIVNDDGVTWTDEDDIRQSKRIQMIMDSLIFANADSIGRSENKMLKDKTRENEERLREQALNTYTEVAEIDSVIYKQNLVDLNDPETSDELIASSPVDDYSTLPGGVRPDPSISYPLGENFRNGIVYRIQIASLNNDMTKEYFTNKYNISSDISIIPYQGTYKYTIGNFATYEEVTSSCDDFVQRTNVNAFITAYKDGERISTWQARNFTGEGSSIETEIPDNTIIYRVQIASLSRDDMAAYFKRKFNLTDKIYVDFYAGAFKYSMGTFTSFSEAKKYSNILRPRIGNVNTFVIAFKNGSIINIWEVLHK